MPAAATYGTVPNATVGSCGSDCFQVSVSNPATRPVQHWDLTVLETIGPPALGQTKQWTLHVGASFPDVPPTHPFYRFVETLLHVGVTAGCTATTYCPDGVTTREQMAVFLLRAREGGTYTPPPCTTAPFPDVPCSSPFAPWVQELVARGITAGCGGGLYCPTAPVTREQMAVFLLKTHDGAAFTPPPCTTATFTDVPCSSPFASWVQELVARAITAGCAPNLYCPTNPVTRGQMAVFLTKTFTLALYGP
jgi:endo-1,4-beta-xylanase